MNPAVLALASRTLNGSAKSIGWHLAIGGLAAMTLAALFRVFQLQSELTAPGLEFMRWSVELNLLVTTLAGIGLFATSISAEREAGTLALLRMAGLGSVGIITARWLPLLLACSALLFVQIPFALLAVTLGGVTPSQVIAAYTAMWLHLFFVASIGLWVSVQCRTSTGAILLATLLLGFWELWPQALMPLITLVGGLSRAMTSEMLAAHEFLDSFRAITGFGRVTDILRSSHASFTWWDWPDLWQIGIGCVAIAWAWASFEYQASSDEPVIVKRVAHRQRRLRPWRNAVLWKDFVFLGGGWRGLMIRTVLYPLAGILFCGGWTPEMMYEPALRMLGWDGAMLLAQVFHKEFREETWDALQLTPATISQLCYRKLEGVALALIPGFIWVLLTMTVWRFAFGGMEHPFYCSLLLLGWHIAVLFSVLFPRFTWVSAFLLGVVSATVEYELVGSMIWSWHSPQWTLFLWLLLNLIACGSMYVLIRVRIRSLSE